MPRPTPSGALTNKYDWCNTEGQDTRDSYMRMSQALAASGRPIVFSICEWGSTQPWLWAQGVGHLWRTTGDIQDCWDCARSWGGMGITHIIDQMAELHPYAGPGHWNDPDMLEVWAKPLANGARAVILFNRGTEPRKIMATWEMVGIFRKGKAQVRDLWKHADLGTLTGNVSVEVEPHGVAMLTVLPRP